MIQIEQIDGVWVALLDGCMILATGSDYNRVKAQAEFAVRHLND